jgi:hypothetical protein
MGGAVLIAAVLMAGLFPHAEVQAASAPVAVRVNGVDLNWSSCVSAFAPPELERALRDRWQRAAAAGEGGDWWVFRHREGTVLHTLQLRPASDGGSSGYCSALDAAGRPHAPARPLLALPGVVTFSSVIEQLDGGVRSVQFLGRVPGEPRGWRRQLLRRAQASGWQAQPGPEADSFELPLALVRADVQVDVVVLRSGAGWQFLLNQHAAESGRP